MLTAEIKVNGNLIGILYISNKGVLEKREVPDVWKYEAIYYEIGDIRTWTTNFTHNRKDGALACLAKAMLPIIKGSKDDS